MKFWSWFLFLILALVVWVMPIEGTLAAETPLPENQTAIELEQSLLGQSLDADDISAEKISQFVRAYLQVLELIERRENELQGAELDSESQQIQQEIEVQAIGLIQASGLTLQEYLQLLSLTNLDPEFGERVAAQLQEASD
jgi:Mg2+ and Co2+ transporter CorA